MTNSVTTAYEHGYRQALDKREVPEHLHEGLIRYLVGGIRPGDFLCAVLSNDLAGAMRLGDTASRAGLFNLWLFLHFDVPPEAWGSPDKVAEHCTSLRESHV